MNPASTSRPGRPDPKTGAEADPRNKKTPNSDMQADDAGTADSGNESSGTEAEGAMKQTSKTGAGPDKKR